MKFLALAVMPLLVAGTALAQDGPLTTNDGVFTEEQAKRGEASYRSSCSRCHGGDLQATDAEAANLSGPAFEVTWVGKTLRERFERVYYTMPVNNPSSLPEQTYLDIIAYILQFNGAPAGDTELTVDLDRLAGIEVAAPPK